MAEEGRIVATQLDCEIRVGATKTEKVVEEPCDGEHAIALGAEG